MAYAWDKVLAASATERLIDAFTNPDVGYELALHMAQHDKLMTLEILLPKIPLDLRRAYNLVKHSPTSAYRALKSLPHEAWGMYATELYRAQSWNILGAIAVHMPQCDVIMGEILTHCTNMETLCTLFAKIRSDDPMLEKYDIVGLALRTQETTNRLIQNEDFAFTNADVIRIHENPNNIHVVKTALKRRFPDITKI